MAVVMMTTEQHVLSLLAEVERLNREIESLRSGVLAERVRCADLAEVQRQKIMASAGDPSWTEHLAEVDMAIVMGKVVSPPPGVHESHLYRAAHYLALERP